MKIKAISLAAAAALASTAAFAQTGNGAGRSSQACGPAGFEDGHRRQGSTTGGRPAMKNDATGTTTGSSRPSPKDASTQGAGTAGAVDKKGDAASPGGTMKK